MTIELDDLPFHDPDWPPAPAVELEPRKCKRHQWGRVQGIGRYDEATGHELGILVDQQTCSRCGKPKDEARSRRGKSSARLGKDGERRSEKRYGWRKVGEFGGITDLEGTLAIVQQKTSRRPAPSAWMGIFRQLEARAGGRIPLILLSFVRAGVDTEDLVVIRGRDWLALHGLDQPGDDPSKHWPIDFERGE